MIEPVCANARSSSAAGEMSQVDRAWAVALERFTDRGGNCQSKLRADAKTNVLARRILDIDLQMLLQLGLFMLTSALPAYILQDQIGKSARALTMHSFNGENVATLCRDAQPGRLDHRANATIPRRAICAQSEHPEVQPAGRADGDCAGKHVDGDSRLEGGGDEEMRG